ncbi:hypothetical protein EC973_003209 [Apophysomyces ossiformis]|uniref:Uncharacterized protein n=1 Tax=Apophysomyces ossiformis TaxID=679940 RepID=A0A8H7BFU3_9FUNG|nr:hypothetical protein EC973_003209 [Apophysomyces ossiformis]
MDNVEHLYVNSSEKPKAALHAECVNRWNEELEVRVEYKTRRQEPLQLRLEKMGSVRQRSALNRKIPSVIGKRQITQIAALALVLVGMGDELMEGLGAEARRQNPAQDDPKSGPSMEDCLRGASQSQDDEQDDVEEEAEQEDKGDVWSKRV